MRVISTICLVDFAHLRRRAAACSLHSLLLSI